MHAKHSAILLLAVLCGSCAVIARGQDIEHNLSSIEIALEPVSPNTARPVVSALSASRDGRLLAIAGDDHVIRLYQFDANNAFENAFSDSASDATAGLSPAVNSTQPPSALGRERLISSVARGLKLIATLEGHTDWIRSLVFSSDAKYLYSSGNDGRVLMWQYGQADSPKQIVELPYAVNSLSLATQRQLLAIGGFSNQVRIWDLKAHAWHAEFPCSCNDQRCVRFSPSGDKLLSGGRDGVVSVWNVETKQQLTSTGLHKDRVQTAAFSADGQVITSAGDDRRLVRYDLSTQKIVFEHELKGAKLRSLYLVNDNLIAVAGADNTIHIFDVLAQAELGTLEGHTGSVAVMGTAAGLLVSGSFDTTVRLWKLESALSKGSGISRPVGLAPLTADPNMDIR